MKTINKRPRKLMRARNKNRVNRIKNQQRVFHSSPLFVLFLISLKLGELTTPEKLLARLRMHIEKLTANTNFPTTDPTLAAQQTMADNLEGAIDAVEAGDSAMIPVRDSLVEDGLEMIRQLSYNIQYQSHGDAVKIKSAGFDTRKPKGPSEAPGQVLNLVAKPVGPGKIKLSWEKEDRSAVYVIEKGNNPPVPGDPMSWDTVGTTRNVTFVVEGLNPGQLYHFRVYGTNGNEDGNPSDPAEQRSL